MNYSKIIIAGITGIALFVLWKKINKKNSGFFEDILFDSEFIPGFQTKFRIPEDQTRVPHFQNPKWSTEDSGNPMFI